MVKKCIKILSRRSMKNLSKHQPKPKKNTNPHVWDLVMKDIEDRVDYGLKKYGVTLQPFNGRDPLIDLYQELLDAVVYTRQLIYERQSSLQ